VNRFFKYLNDPRTLKYIKQIPAAKQPKLWRIQSVGAPLQKNLIPVSHCENQLFFQEILECGAPASIFF